MKPPGRPRTPLHILKARGSRRVNRHTAEPTAPPGQPTPPTYLDDEARAHWDWLIPLLDQMGVLSRIEEATLIRYCQLWSRWREADRIIGSEGVMVPVLGDDGSVTGHEPHKLWRGYDNLCSQLLRLEQQFGMTPASRASLRTQDDKPKGQASKPKTRFFTA